MRDKFADNFSVENRLAGERLLAEGKLLARFGSAELFRAEILAEGLPECSWRVAGNRLNPECGCLEFKSGKLCPHLWGALCLAQRQEALGKALQKNIRRQITPVVSGGSAAEQDTYYELESRSLPRRRAVRHPEPRPVIPAPSSNPLPETGRGKTAADTGEQPDLLYVLDLDRMSPEHTHLGFETWWKTTTAEGKPVCHPFYPDAETRFSQPFDAAMFRILLPGKKNPGQPANYFQVSEAGIEEALALLAGTGRLRWYRSTDKPPRFHRLHCSGGNPLPLRFRLQQQAGGQYLLQGMLCSPEKQIPFAELLFLSAAGIVVSQECLMRFDRQVAPALTLQAWQDSRLLPAGLVLSGPAAEELCREFCLHGWQNALEPPAELICHRLPGEPRGVLFVQTAEFKFAGREQLHAELSFEYEGCRCQPADPRPCVPGNRPREVIERNFTAETALMLRLQSLDFCREGKTAEAWRLLPSRLDPVIRTLVMEDWFVTAAGKTYRKPLEKKAFVQKTGLDWFEISGEVDFAGRKMPLPVLLQALRRGAGSVRLDDGTYGILPLEWLEKFTALTELGDDCGEKIRFRRQQSALVAALVEERLQDADGQFALALAALQQQGRPAPCQGPPGFMAQLRFYQAEGLGWLLAMAQAGLGVCLADDMGLGKTVQVLALLAWRKQQNISLPSLVVVPRSLIFNWSSEAARFAPQLRQGFYLGNQREEILQHLDTVDVLFTTYGTLRQNPVSLAQCKFDYCILDESQAIRNAASATALAARTLQAEHRLTMTGTPVENRLAELFSQLEFLNPGLFGERFLRQFERSSLILSDVQARRLQQAIRPFLLRRTKEEVATELPPKREQVVFCELEGMQRVWYDELKEYYRTMQLDAKRETGGLKLEALTALLRLRQAACHPGLINEQRAGESSAKQEFLLERLEELAASGRKALVFSQFSRFLRLLEPGLRQLGLKYCFLDGATANRAELVTEFQQDPGISVFLISLKAGGVGLNLTAAEYVFILDPWWNPAAEAQAIDRAYRIGQTRAVFAYRLIARNTVEEKVLQLQQSKRRLAETVLSAAPRQGLALTPQDLAFLLE